ncbi:MAG TPA: Hsp20/alpha crystallin family protein [Chlamydiales bacterium]|nr:Hsp20/alpha crystallin family protein [Chlamydiales bacterium]
MTLATLFQDVEEAFRRSPSGVTINETDEAFILEAFVAGVKPKDIQISTEKRSLCIEAKGSGYSYSYLVPIPPGQIDETATPEAIAEDGILRITFPKAKAAKPLKITVKGA